MTETGPVEGMWIQGVVEQNRRWLLAYLLAATGDFSTAEDLVQETFQIAYQKRNEFDPRYQLGAWLRGIAKNLLKRHFAAVAREACVVSWECIEKMGESVSDREWQDKDPGFGERRLAALEACLEKLTQRTRELLSLHYICGRSLKEVAERMKIGLSNVGVMMFRARRELEGCVTQKVKEGV